MKRLIVTATLLGALFCSCPCCHGQVKCPKQGRTSFTVIPAEKINDGYCDCPLTGVDEPETAACAGSNAWAAVLRGGESSPNESLLFTCPKQPNLKLALSRVHDGVCDCCDGADEGKGVCKDGCDAIFAEQRRLRKEQEENYKIGSKIRQKAIEDFVVLRKEKLDEAAKLETEVELTESSLDQLTETYKTLEMQWITDRLTFLDSQLQAIALTPTASADKPIVTGMLEALSAEELTWWVIHACQISGEMMSADGSFAHDNDGGNSKTCIPLRMAGLDAQIWWEPQTYEMTLVKESDNSSELWSALAQLFDFNLKNPDDVIWNRNRLTKKSVETGRRRRLEDLHDEYEEYDDLTMDDDRLDDPDHDEEDDFEEENRHRRRPTRIEVKDKDGADSETAGVRREEILNLLKTQSFSIPRVRYLEQSSGLLDIIEVLTKEDKDDSGADDAELAETPEQVEKIDAEAVASPSSNSDVQFDPMALPMTKNKLERRADAVDRGFDFAISARVLLDSMSAYSYKGDSELQKLQDLRRLALGVVNHGKLSSYHVWQLYRAVVPEFSGPSETEGEEGSCVAPWASSCPPLSTKRSLPSGEELDVPPQLILEEATSFCNALMSQASGAESMCSAPDPNHIIPTEIPDGYLGYYQVSPRSDDDLMSRLFAGLGLQDKSDQRKQLLDMQDQTEALEEKLKKSKSAIEETFDSVGGRDEPQAYGMSGELFHIKDSCLTYDTPSYTYELCLFQKAKQRDRGSKSGGVNLGDWQGQSIEETSEEGPRRVWKWEGGAKCWNGPKRSATAVVTCGKASKILSADEPETCTYVLRVESPIGCDEEFRARHNL